MIEAVRHWMRKNKEKREELSRKADAEAMQLLDAIVANANAAFDVRREYLAKAALKQVAGGQQ